MSLDLPQLAAHLLQMVAHLRAGAGRGQERRRRALEAWERWASHWEELRERLGPSPGPGASAVEALWPVVEPLEPWEVRRPPPPAPEQFTVLATDGSHMDVDRNSPARYSLVNIGRAELTYGPHPSATLDSRPYLRYQEGDLSFDDGEGRVELLEGPILSLWRAVLEAQTLAEYAAELPAERPAIALLDGSLVLWGLGSYPVVRRAAVRRRLLDEGYLQALDALQVRAQQGPLALAGYISYPRSAEVVNLLRIAVCSMAPPSQFPACLSCRSVYGVAPMPCEAALGGLLDRDLFEELLEPGERSPLFGLCAPLVRELYGGRELTAFYLHTGQEIARVEVPGWVAGNEALLAQTHALVWDQVQRGRGYPVALQEAHERAVITTAEREQVSRLVERALGESRLTIRTSAKRRSKRLRWL